jgi:hypothetical protein
MRTKALLGLAALAVGLSTSVAQNVYSLNVVGYVNVTLTANKLSFLSIPLAPVDGNFNITNTIVLDSSQNFANLYRWINNNWDTSVSYLDGWSKDGLNNDVFITNGVAFFIASPATSTLTFVGQVNQGAMHYSFGPGLSAVGNQVPVSTNFPGATIGNAFDGIILWNPNAVPQSWNTDWGNTGGGWANGGSPTGPGGPDNVNGPLINPAEGFLYQNGGTTPVAFTQNFTVQ